MLKVNEKEIVVTKFPDKTSQVWNLPESLFAKSPVQIDWDFENEGELMQLAQLKALFDSKNIAATLYLNYLPYGRQDKEVSNDATFALLPFAQLLNSLRFQSVTILDPHSEKALSLIDHAQAIYLTDEVNQIFTKYADLVCYPDHGALTKYSKIYRDLPFLFGEKIRDQASGRILNYKLQGDPTNKRILIVDDICDGGQTFILLAKELLQRGAKDVVLFVTHGIFSKGTDILFQSGISQVYAKKGRV